MLIAARRRDRVELTMLAAKSENILGSPRFEALRVLGEGGSGIVYEVRLRSGIDAARPTLALKVLRAELAPSERERRRFLEEADRMQRLDAPGLVKLLEAGLLPDGRPYLAMPLLDGETLAARLRRGPLPAETAVRHLEVLARAVHALHVAGMVHRDVKPENVMLVDDAAVLLDFGIARDIDDDTTTTTAEGRVRGTPAYMAPERFFGAPASVRSDVYELGVVLYTMLVGRLPWGSEKNVTERLNPTSPREAGADVSRSLADVILRALSTRPEMRPASAEELARDVAAASKDRSSITRRTADVAVQAPPDGSELAFSPTELAPGAVARASSEAPPPLRGGDSTTTADATRFAGAAPSRRTRRTGLTVAGVAALCALGAAAYGVRAVRSGATAHSSHASSPAPGARATAEAPAPLPAASAAGATGGANASDAASASNASSDASSRTASTSNASSHASGSAGAASHPSVGAGVHASGKRPIAPAAGAGRPAPSSSADPSRYFEDRR
jgi:serine/threonine-protein kinase